ncbi:MAG TPA: thermonuclease family protein, partial [Reyranella sp.]|nr:thermonuclease family protein [Reyranella sp.]
MIILSGAIGGGSLLFGALAPAHAETSITGQAHVIDGDTFDIGEERIRLADIDAPELGQSCQGPKELRRCGKLAAEL